MTIAMYDLAGARDQRFSPHCWRARMALAHKGLDVVTRATRFTDIAKIADGEQKTVPVIDDDGTLVSDSMAIAEYLERTYNTGPSLFDGAHGLSYAKFLNHWANSILLPGVVRLIVKDIHDRLDEGDRDYFRSSREKRFGKSLEDTQVGREEGVARLALQMAPLRMALASAPFLGGEEPFYGDYAVFGVFQWARVISPFQVLKEDEPVRDWIERCLDLHGAVARSQAAA